MWFLSQGKGRTSTSHRPVIVALPAPAAPKFLKFHFSSCQLKVGVITTAQLPGGNIWNPCHSYSPRFWMDLWAGTFSCGSDVEFLLQAQLKLRECGRM